MADFYQTGVVTTLHRLTPNSIDRLEADLEKFSRNKPIGLVLPALYSEFESLAMQRIVPELRKVRYLQRIVVALARATPEQFDRARGFFRDFYTPVTVLWMDSGDPRNPVPVYVQGDARPVVTPGEVVYMPAVLEETLLGIQYWQVSTPSDIHAAWPIDAAFYGAMGLGVVLVTADAYRSHRKAPEG